ncbi:hypothetical protein KI387_005337, partial [Taxus chinensis]
DKKLFDSLHEEPTGDRVRIADVKEYIAEGIGNVTIPLGPRKCTLTKVLYVPGLTRNLLSVTQLLNHHLKVEFLVQNGIKSCLISRQERDIKLYYIIPQLKRKGYLVWINKNTCSNVCHTYEHLR